MKRGKKGFTLMEMLIVVAIIGVLTAISIPTFSNTLKKSKAAVDAAAVRNAKAVAVTTHLLENDGTDKTYYFDSNCILYNDPTGIVGYGKSDVELPNEAFHLPDDFAEGVPKDGYVSITITALGEVSACWNGGTVSPTPEESDPPSGETNAFEKNFSTTLNWNDMKANSPYGMSLTWGTVFNDGDAQFLVFGTQNYYDSLSSYASGKDFANANSNHILELNSSITPLTVNSINDMDVVAGTIWKYNNEYYAARESYHADYTHNPTSANWVKISGQ